MAKEKNKVEEVGHETVASKIMAREAAKAEEVVEAPKAKKGVFVVIDANGNPFRTFDGLEEAEAFAKVVKGKVK